MDQSLYSQSLIISLPLMLFFSFHMLLGRTLEKRVFANYLLSRRLMGFALLILSANYSVHLFYSIRTKDINATILMNLSTYFICYWLFSSAMITLLDNKYITRRRFVNHIAMWFLFSALACVVTLLSPANSVFSIGLLGLAIWLVGYGLFLAARILRTYYRSIKMFEDTHSDDIGSYIRWMSIFTYWAIGYGVSCSLLTFLPDKYIFIWILSSIPFFIYLYCCYQNYILFYEKVETAFMEDNDINDTDTSIDNHNADIPPSYHPDIEKRIQEWIDKDGYLKPGITLNELSMQLCTNRTYLSQFINSTYHVSFRDWITNMRIEYAKRLMQQQNSLRLQEISEASGFLSLSHFTRTFKAKEGCSPSRWRKTSC